MMRLLVVEDTEKLRPAMVRGLESTGEISVVYACGSGEEAVQSCLESEPPPDAVLMDVQLEGAMNGIEAAVAIRRELPRHPVVFYSIQDDDTYYRDFRRSGILSHYAYVRKSNYLLPALIVPLLRDAAAGRSFIDPEVEARVQEVRHGTSSRRWPAGAERTAGRADAGPGVEQRTDRGAHGLSRQAHDQPDQRADLHGVGAERDGD